MCVALLARLNSLPPRCTQDAIETYAGFSEPPWQELDPKQHEALIAKLLRYWQVGPRRYFDPTTPRSESEDAAYVRKAKDFIAEGGKLRIWRTRLVPTFNGKPAPAADQTVVLLDSYYPSAYPGKCPGKRSKGWIPALFLVAPDLSGPSQEIDAGNASVLYSGTVMLHEGIPYLLNPYTVFRGFGDAGLHGVCSFKEIEKAGEAK